MKILVANLGSTSFKYRLFDMIAQAQLARGGIERIGAAESPCQVEIGDWQQEHVERVPDHAVAVRICLAQLTDQNHGCLSDAAEVAGIGFKAVHGGSVSGVQRVTTKLLERMEEMNSVAPAHNPAYIRAMRQLSEQLPEMPLVAAFETGFHATIPARQQYYAIPYTWSEQYHVKRWGFHGASHCYIAGRVAELLGRDDLRIISCHLGGSSSLCAIREGKSMANTLGMSPQTGLPHNNRVGEFDPFALPLIMKQTGKTLGEVLNELATQSGLLGLSGLSGDVRDIEEAAVQGDSRAQLALQVFTTSIRNHLGAQLVELGGAEAIVFTGGIGENSSVVRAAVCDQLEELGVVLSQERNEAHQGEGRICDERSPIQIWVVPTNEELVVARQTHELLTES